jgi:hypothetical protein
MPADNSRFVIKALKKVEFLAKFHDSVERFDPHYFHGELPLPRMKLLRSISIILHKIGRKRPAILKTIKGQ